MLRRLIVLVVAAMAGGGVVQAADPPELRIGALLPRTGMAASVGPEIEAGIKHVLAEAGYRVDGRKIVLIDEDESDSPATAVAKARKLVEVDKVDVVIGPILAHSSAAVSPYLARNGVPHLPWGMAEKPASSHSIFTAGTGTGNAYVAGQFAGRELKRRKAALLNMDYALGHQMRDGFIDGFKAAGGSIVSNQLLPLGTSDLSPYFEGLGNADILAVLMVNPTDLAFTRQYREFGVKIPVIFISAQPQEEPVLQQMGADVAGMYGVTMYGPMIDSPANRQFVSRFQERVGRRPGIATVHAGYWTTAMVLTAAKNAGPKAGRAELGAALARIRDLDTPAGRLSISEKRMGIHDVYVFQAGRKDNLFVWNVIKRYPAVAPQY